MIVEALMGEALFRSSLIMAFQVGSVNLAL
jgi:hypothetical protein